MANWILKFISGKYQGGEFPLEEGKDYTIGRAGDSDMVLVEDMVSRHHSKITVINDVVHLNDLGSTNGSFVNGERVRDAILKEGDRILFGTSIIKLVRVAGGAPRGASAPDPETTRHQSSQVRPGPEPEPAHAAPAPPPTPATGPVPAQQQTAQNAQETQSINRATIGAMTGMLEEIALPDLLQLFAASRKNGVLRIQAEKQAALYLKDGRVKFVEIEGSDGLDPEKAAYRVMTWNRGMFVLEPAQEREFEKEIELGTESLMMEAMRLLDEMEHLRDKPDPNADLALGSPLVPPLRALTPELLDTLQLVINHGNVTRVLDNSLASDLETMQDISYLIKHEYVIAS